MPDRNIRVAILYAQNTSGASYGSSGIYHSNFSGLMDLLVGAGYTVTNLTYDDVLDHKLQPINYDVLVLADILPADELLDPIHEFWLGGGGVLSIDGSINVLMYTGILPLESAGDNGYTTYWSYGSDEMMTINAITPATRSFDLNDDFNGTSFGWATFDWTALQGTSDSDQMTPFLVNKADHNDVAGLSYDSLDRGGRVIQIAGSADKIIPIFANIYIDSIEWLAPRPRGKIAFDLSHHPRLGVDSWDDLAQFHNFYSDIRDFWVGRGYTFDKIYPETTGNLTTDRLNQFDMLILITPDYNYTSAEVDAIVSWVSGGGSLFILVDGPSSSFAAPVDQVNRFATTFGVPVNTTTDPNDGAATRVEHPLVEGCYDLTVSGAAILPTGSDAFPLWKVATSTLIAGATYGSGRVVISGDMNWMDNNHLSDDDAKIFARNIANWLINYDAKVVLYTNDSLNSYDLGPAAQALHEIGLRFYAIFNETYLNRTLDDVTRDLLVVDAPNVIHHQEPFFARIEQYVLGGGRLLITTYNLDSYAGNSLWPLLGVAYSTDVASEPTLYMWDATHPVFNTPIDFSITQFESNSGYFDDGDTVHVFANATGIAGRTSLSQENESFITVRNDGMTIYNSLVINLLTDGDGSGYSDSFEIYINEIAFLMRPSIDSPADLTYNVGETGNSITWTPSSYNPASYEITRNGTVVDSGAWDGSPITINVDGLDAGTYVFEITVTDVFGQSATDQVVVTVESGGIPFVPPGFLQDYFLYIVAGLVILVILIIVIKKRK